MLASPSDFEVDQPGRTLLPAGSVLPTRTWQARHRGIRLLLWAHVPLLLVIGVARHHAPAFVLVSLLPVVVATAAAGSRRLGRASQASLATFALVFCSALLVHFGDGNIEMHFHFFVVVGIITLYQEWVPFAVALTFVVLEHGVVGVLAPESVYNHHHAQTNPWLWAAIHGAFVLAASVPHLLAWRLNEDQALRDPLTRLSNRTLIVDRLNKEIARRRHGHHRLAVLFLDLDNFKHVNDTLGHAVGDEFLVVCASRLLTCVRDRDLVGRLGGDEFAVILSGPHATRADEIADRVLRSFRDPVMLNGHELIATVSIGIAYAEAGTSAADLLRNADLAMYCAKTSGRGRYETYDSTMHDRAVERLNLETDLRHAIAMDAITVAYQPITAIDDGDIRGVEALARWHHPARGDVSPAVFIDVAERSGLIGQLGERVLLQAFRSAARMHAIRPGLYIAVNVSAVQLRDPMFPSTVARLLGETNVDPTSVVLEVTETALVQDVAAASERLTELKALGVRIAIDDFGVGHSSLSYLRSFPVDVLKIDKSFIDGLAGNGTPLASAVIQLGQMLGLDVVAEGIETQHQVNELRRLGLEHGQGNHFARPMTEDNLVTALSTQLASQHRATPKPRETSST